MGLVPMAMPIVSGTVKECRVDGCTQPAKTKGVLCTAHAVRRATYTVFQLGGLIGLAITGFVIAFWLGMAISSVAVLGIGLALET